MICVTQSSQMDSDLTAAVIVVNDKVLRGEVPEFSSHLFCKELRLCGIKLSRYCILPNEESDIAEEIARSSSKCTYVLVVVETGPLCSETYKGVAKAFSEDLVFNKYLCDVLHCSPKNGFSEKSLSSMSVVPKSSAIYHIADFQNSFSLPVIRLKNIYIFQSISFQHDFILLKSLFAVKNSAYNRNIYLKTESHSFVKQAVNECIRQFEGKVQFLVKHVYEHVYRWRVLIAADSEQQLNQVEAYFRASLSLSNAVVNHVHMKSNQCLKEFSEFLSSDVARCEVACVLRKTVAVIETCLKRYKPKSICLSFNGGKDCTVLLHIVSCIWLQNHYTDKLKVFYVRSGDPFPETEEFIQLSVERYELELLSFEYPIKDALSALKTTKPEIEAILMGTRSTDPQASDLQAFQMTDKNWPQFMRVSPLLHWDYHHVWQFLRHLNIPYCSLYDQGYTSLGCRNNTLPNPKLKRHTPKGKEFFCPAYLLEEPSKEREGRSSNL